MRFGTVRDVLLHVRDFHHRLARLYEELGINRDDERVRMLLHYFGRHERHLQESLELSYGNTAEDLLETWIDFAPPDSKFEMPNDLKDRPFLSTDELTEKALEMDGRLVKIYRELIRQTDTPALKQVFESLLEMEQNEQRRLVRQALRINDI